MNKYKEEKKEKSDDLCEGTERNFAPEIGRDMLSFPDNLNEAQHAN